MSVVATRRGNKAFTTAAPTTTATLLLAANAQRIVAQLGNTGTATVFLGKDNTVTTASGLFILPGDLLFDDDTKDAWWGITAAGTGAVGAMEVA